MVLRLKSKNAKLNAAATGFASGFQGGIRIGQRQQEIDLDKEEAMRRAKIADQEIQQEAQDRAAVGDAADVLTQDDPMQGTPPTGAQAGAMIGGGSGIGAGARLGAQDAQAVQRVRAIAHKLPPKYAIPFVQEAAAKHKAFIDERTKKTITDEAARGVAAGSYFVQQPNGERVSTPAVDDAIKKLNEAAGDPKSTPAQISGLKANLDREQIIAKSTFEHVQRQMVDLRSRIDQAAQPSTPGPQSASGYAAQSAKTRKLQMMASTYEHLAPQLMADPEKMREFETKFWPEFSQAEQGIAFQDKDYGSVSFEAADQFMRLKQDNERLKAQAEQTKAALDAAKLQDVPAAAADRAKNADANMIRSQRVPGPASGTVSRPLSQAEALNRAMEIQKANGGDTSPTRLKFIARQLMQGDEETAPTGAPTPEATNAANAGQTSRAAAISPEAAVKAGWTTDEFDAYVDHGTMPKGKPIK